MPKAYDLGYSDVAIIRSLDVSEPFPFDVVTRDSVTRDSVTLVGTHLHGPARSISHFASYSDPATPVQYIYHVRRMQQCGISTWHVSM